MSRIFVTGASGFIGRATVAVLAKAGHSVRAGVRRPPDPSFPTGIEVATHPDLSEPFDWMPLIDGCDAIIHLAGIAHAGRGIPELAYDRVNCVATARLAEAAARAGVARFVFVSSIRAQCGAAADHALNENDPPRPTNPYGRSKLAAEDAIRASGVPFTVLRPVLVYGPGVKGNFALLLRAAMSRWPLPVKEFDNRRSLLSVDNLASAIAFTISAPAAAGETYVVADPGIAMRISDVIATLREAIGRRRMFLPMPVHYVEMPLRMLRRGELWDRFGGNLRVNPGKLLTAGWQPCTDTRTGLIAVAQAASPRKSGTASRSTR
jgi:UDP-glucose 4-epimerase